MQLSITTANGVVYSDKITTDGTAVNPGTADSSKNNNATTYSVAADGTTYQQVAAEVNAAVAAAVSNVSVGSNVSAAPATSTLATSTQTSSIPNTQGLLALNSLTSAVSQAKANLATNGRTLDSIFKEASQTYGVDYNLLTALAFCESGFDANEKSSAGAMGMMQLMPSTAKSLGITNAYDAYENIMGGAKLLGQFLDKYKDAGVALAAYNAGYGRVDAAGGQIPNIDSVKAYVNKVLNYAQTGVEVPDITYKTDNAEKLATAEKLEKLLAEYSNHSSYNDFVAAFTEELTKEATSSSDPSSVYGSYEKLLSSASRAITSVMKNIKES